MPIKGLHARLQDTPVLYNGWLHVPSTLTASLMASGGYGAVTVDMQHGAIDDASMFEVLSTLAQSPALPLVRVAANDPAAVMRALDAGALGVICPLIDDAEACARFVDACYYPPVGGRSWGPLRARAAYGAYEPAEVNEIVASFAMIETRAGLDAVDAIAATPGLTGLFVGPSDLSFALKGDPTVDFTSPPLVEALERVLDACRLNDLVPGIFTTNAVDAKRVRELGFRLVTLGTDAGLLERKIGEEFAAL